MRRMTCEKGYTLIELLISVFLTGILTLAGLKFYAQVHNQTLTQEDIGDMQAAARNSLEEISGTLRNAGYKVAPHAAYYISDDTLMVFYSQTQAVDTVAYFLDWPRTLEGMDDSHRTYSLMKQTNSDPPAEFARYIKDVTYTLISPSVIDIVVSVEADRSDEDFVNDDGLRAFSLSERVQLRNLKL